jgi:hypothetical protein
MKNNFHATVMGYLAVSPLFALSSCLRLVQQSFFSLQRRTQARRDAPLL